MNIKIQFSAYKKAVKLKDGKPVLDDKGNPVIEKTLVKDSILAKDLKGQETIYEGIGQNIGNELYKSSRAQPGWIIPFEDQCKTLFNNQGKEITLTEEFAKIMLEWVDANCVSMLSSAFHEKVEDAISVAKLEEESKKAFPENRGLKIVEAEEVK